MARTIVQKVVVDIAATANQTVIITPAVNTSEPQQLAVSVGGTDQTVILRPVE